MIVKIIEVIGLILFIAFGIALITMGIILIKDCHTADTIAIATFIILFGVFERRKSMNKESFGSFIKELRQNKKYTQQELADLLYLDVSSVSKWERGVSYPDITLIPKICEILEVDEHELIKSSRDLEYQRIKEEGLKFK